MNYLQNLKEAAQPKPIQPIVKMVTPSKLNKDSKESFKRLWIKFVDEDNKHARKFRDQDMGTDEQNWNWIQKQPALVYIKGDDILGYLTIKKIPKFNKFYLVSFMVEPTQRSQGIGSALMKKAVEVAKKGGYKQVDLNMWESNKKALKLYLKHGFKRMTNTMRKFI